MGLLADPQHILDNLPLILLVLVFVTVARASFVYMHYFVSKTLRLKGQLLPKTWYDMLVLAGVRGAIPIVLALTLTQSSLPIPLEIRETITSTVIGAAIISVTLQNLIANRYVKKYFAQEKNAE